MYPQRSGGSVAFYLRLAEQLARQKTSSAIPD